MKLSNTQISKDLTIIAENLPKVSFASTMTIYQNGSFKISCKPDSTTVLKIAKKFTSKRKLTTSIRSTASGRVSVKQFVIDGEISNAINYATLMNKPLYFAKTKKEPLIIVDAKEFKSGFVLGRVFHDNKLQAWNVTHLKTGMTCSCASSDKQGSLLKFESVEGDIEKHY